MTGIKEGGSDRRGVGDAVILSVGAHEADVHLVGREEDADNQAEAVAQNIEHVAVVADVASGYISGCLPLSRLGHLKPLQQGLGYIRVLGISIVSQSFFSKYLHSQ